MKFYAGIGSRSTPTDILNIFTKTAKWLDGRNYVLRSGGAKGADSAFEYGAINKQIFYANDATDRALEIASNFHPAWNRCSDYIKKLHGRNTFQILGRDLKTPVDFVICWTPDGCESHEDRSIKTGGTGTAISIASYYNIPVFNFANPDSIDRLREILKLIK